MPKGTQLLRLPLIKNGFCATKKCCCRSLFQHHQQPQQQEQQQQQKRSWNLKQNKKQRHRVFQKWFVHRFWQFFNFCCGRRRRRRRRCPPASRSNRRRKSTAESSTSRSTTREVRIPFWDPFYIQNSKMLSWKSITVDVRAVVVVLELAQLAKRFWVRFQLPPYWFLEILPI